ncbi:MAG: hypothetical protein GVY07_14280 [Bacteroidetes bacterium]|nr:hypothetical protein [Bacteroidota bacterium]
MKKGHKWTLAQLRLETSNTWIAPVQSHPGGVVHVVTPGGGLMKSGALKRVRNPGITTYSKPNTPRQ